MSRHVITLGLIFCSLMSTRALAQQNCQEQTFCQSFKTDYYRNKMWPYPFRAMDSSAVLAHFEVQRNNGWRLNNTLGAGMFHPTTHALTDSGRALTQWIISRAPEGRRTIFILQADTQEATARRVESAQLAISQLVPVGPLPALYLTTEDAPGSSGDYQTAINRALTSSVPAPRLPNADGSAATSSAGAGTGTPTP